MDRLHTLSLELHPKPSNSLNNKYLKYIIVWYDFQFHSTSRYCIEKDNKD